jgi:hypothetical protein
MHEFSFVQERAVLFNFNIIEEAVTSVFCVVLKELNITFGIFRCQIGLRLSLIAIRIRGEKGLNPVTRVSLELCN